MHKYTQNAVQGLHTTEEISSQPPIKQNVKKKRTVLVFEDTVSPKEKIVRATARRAELDAVQVTALAARRKASPGVVEKPVTEAEILARRDFASAEFARKNGQKIDEPLLNTLDLKPPPPSKFGDKAVKLRTQCLSVGKNLTKRGQFRAALLKAGKKIQNCRVVGLFQEVSPTVHYKIGAALCKQRLCPNCQRVLSAKRKQNTLAWFAINREQLRKYFYYHMVLTVPHSEAEGVRTGLYVGEMLENFARLRGTAKGMPGKMRERAARWWNGWIAGGFYHVETIPARSDKTAHTHIHIIVLAKKQLWSAAKSKKSVFMKQVEPIWARLTDNDKLFKGVFVDPVYYIDEETGNRVNCHFGSSVNLEGAVSEAAKYTMKADSATLDGFTDDFLEEMLTTKNRYYGRFGCLNAKSPDSKVFEKLDMLCTDFKDLEQVSELEARRLFNPETGEIVMKEDTRLLVTPFRNMRQTETAGWVEGSWSASDGKARTNKEREAGEKMVIGETVYLLEREAGYASYYGPDDKATAVGRMSMSLTNEYDASIDIVGH